MGQLFQVKKQFNVLDIDLAREMLTIKLVSDVNKLLVCFSSHKKDNFRISSFQITMHKYWSRVQLSAFYFLIGTFDKRKFHTVVVYNKNYSCTNKKKLLSCPLVVFLNISFEN